jgi:hypothetical protein
MFCARCGTALTPADRFCAACGTPAGGAQPATGPTASPGEMLASAGQSVARAARDVDSRLRNPALLNRLPGRSLAIVGYAVLLLAIVLDLIPGAHGRDFFAIGYRASRLGQVWVWILLVLTLAAATGRMMLASSWRTGRPAPRGLTHPALPMAVLVLTAAEAYRILGFALIPLLVLIAALILGYDAARTGVARTAGVTWERRATRVPWLTALGVALCLFALLLSWWPGNPHSALKGLFVIGSDRTGTAWGWILLVLGLGVIALEVMRARQVPMAAGLIRALPWIVGGYVLLLVAFALAMFDLSLVPLIWAFGAAIAAYDRFRLARIRTRGALSLRQLAVGPRRLVLLGVPLCLLALNFTWSATRTAAYFIGGYDYNYYGGYYNNSYNYTKYLQPGFNFSLNGYSLGPSDFSFTPIIVFALLALVVLALWVSSRPAPTWAFLAPGVLVAVVLVWNLIHMAGRTGPWIFLIGALALAVAAVLVALPTVRAMSAAAPPPPPPAMPPPTTPPPTGPPPSTPPPTTPPPTTPPPATA